MTEPTPTTERPSGAKTTTLYIPAECREAAEALHAQGHSWSDIFRAGLQVMAGQGDHQHTYACTGCGAAQPPATPAGATEWAQLVCGWLGVASAAEVYPAITGLRERLAELETAREDGEDMTAGMIGAAAAAEDELRTWREWARQLCVVLGQPDDAERVIPAIERLRAKAFADGYTGTPLAPLSAPVSPAEPPGLESPAVPPQAPSVPLAAVGGLFETAPQEEGDWAPQGTPAYGNAMDDAEAEHERQPDADPGWVVVPGPDEPVPEGWESDLDDPFGPGDWESP